MPTPSDAQQLLDRLTELARLVQEQQAMLFALFEYHREQPAWNAIRFGTLYAEQRRLLNLPPIEPTPESLDAALRNWLKNFEGPRQ